MDNNPNAKIPIVAYVSPHCPACVRLVDMLKGVDTKVRVVDVATLTEANRQALEVVPTILDAEDRRAYRGEEAFQFVARMDQPLTGVQLLGGKELVFSDFETFDGTPQTVSFETIAQP